MDEKIKKEVIKKTQCKLYSCNDYKEFQSKYKKGLNNIKEDKILTKLKKIEDLLDKKVKLEIIQAYNIASNKAELCRDINIKDTLLINGVEDAAQLGELYASSTLYRNNENKLKQKMNELHYSVSGTVLEKAINEIYEVYYNCCFELIRAALYVGYFSDLHLFLGNTYDITTLQLSEDIIGKKLRYCRRYASLTQEEMAKIFKIKRASISKYECGATIPSVKNLLKYSIYFNIDITDLIDDRMSLDSFIDYYSNKIIQLPKAI